MKLMKYPSAYINDDAVEADELYFDGYSIGERMLEGLVIKVTNTDGEPTITADWPKGVDVAYWTGKAHHFLKYTDVLSTTPKMDDDDGYIDWERNTLTATEAMKVTKDRYKQTIKYLGNK